MITNLKRPDLVAVDVRARDAFGIHTGTHYSCGAWIVTEAGELHVLADGTVSPRPTPLPWSRPSVAAMPHLTRRR